jgi:hypothetical protein
LDCKRPFFPTFNFAHESTICLAGSMTDLDWTHV